MGGGEFIDFDTTRKHRSHSSGVFGAVSADTFTKVGHSRSVSTDLLPALGSKIRTVRCFHKHPIVCILDVTGSMGDAVFVIYEKLGTFFIQIENQGYLDDPAVSFAAVGDCYCDSAPLQVADFSQSMELVENLEKMYIEHGGGGQHHESYETMLYYYWKHCELPDAETPFLFIIGDEGFYDTVSKDHLRRWLGEKEAREVDSREVIRQLLRKFAGNVFLLHLDYRTPLLDGEIVAQWREVLGENLIHLTDPTLVVEVMLGLIAMTMNRRTMTSYLDDFRYLYTADRLRAANPGPNDVNERVHSMRQMLTPYSQSINALAKVEMDGALPGAGAGTTRRRG